MLLWADHASILNHGHLVLTIRVLYNTKIFYTDDEIESTSGRKINVQALVETPELYTICNTSDSLAEKLSYTNTRLEDVKQLEIPLDVDGVKVMDTMRIFLGIYIVNVIA